MNDLFAILFFLSFLLLIVGIIKPNLVIRWGLKRTRGRVFLTYALSGVIFFILFGVTSPPQPANSVKINQPQIASAAKSNSATRDNPLAGVYHPGRLEVKDPDKTISGAVERVRHEKDGDYHINLKLDPQFSDLINAKNTSEQHGDLIIEIIPMDEPNIPTPAVGKHISVTGAYVLDKDHGWMEIHPAWIVDGYGFAKYNQATADRSAKSPSDEESEATSSKSDKSGSQITTQANTSSVQSVAMQTPAPAPQQQSAPLQQPEQQPQQNVQQQVTVQIISVSSLAPRNSMATLTAKVTPRAIASIEVDYKSGPSHAAGLGDKTAGSDGIVSWSWRVGGRTTIGSWPITVSSNGASASTSFEVVH